MNRFKDGAVTILLYAVMFNIIDAFKRAQVLNGVLLVTRSRRGV